MQLHEFITETLSQIAKGIADANQKLKGSSAIVNPRHVNYNSNEHIRAYGWLTESKEKLRAVQLVEFDIALTATEGKENRGGIGVALGSIGLGTSTKENLKHVAQTASNLAYQWYTQTKVSRTRYNPHPLSLPIKKTREIHVSDLLR